MRLAVFAVGAVSFGCGCGTANESSSVVGAPRDPPHARTSIRHVTLGRSRNGRPIAAIVIGGGAASNAVLVVGCVHGNERGGIAITRALRRARPPANVTLWLVDSANPDGCAVGTRQNAHGVDLNRNSPWRWRHVDRPGGLFWSGPGPISEPESRAINRFVRSHRPVVSIWYHQHARLVDASGHGRGLERHYARLVGLPLRRYRSYPGSITGWQDAAYPRDTAFVVELPAGSLSPRAIRRHVRAVLSVAASAVAQR